MKKKTLNLETHLEKQGQQETKVKNAIGELQRQHKYLLKVVGSMKHEINALRDQINDLKSRR